MSCLPEHLEGRELLPADGERDRGEDQGRAGESSTLEREREHGEELENTETS